MYKRRIQVENYLEHASMHDMVTYTVAYVLIWWWWQVCHCPHIGRSPLHVNLALFNRCAVAGSVAGEQLLSDSLLAIPQGVDLHPHQIDDGPCHGVQDHPEGCCRT